MYLPATNEIVRRTRTRAGYRVWALDNLRLIQTAAFSLEVAITLSSIYRRAPLVAAPPTNSDIALNLDGCSGQFLCHGRMQTSSRYFAGVGGVIPRRQWPLIWRRGMSAARCIGSVFHSGHTNQKQRRKYRTAYSPNMYKRTTVFPRSIAPPSLLQCATCSSSFAGMAASASDPAGLRRS